MIRGEAASLALYLEGEGGLHTRLAYNLHRREATRAVWDASAGKCQNSAARRAPDLPSRRG